ncbi:U3 small nucleolar RNA-associated protein MPP10 [Colletotrichum tanaceti]|uniref:U3 small nucleolar ribonucleoprotein protein MPP10 n=1 Tax=Colletotrichum tanaceti TaxID=1306861 RepID=A0A4V6DH57_9PEZI|nr:U3 small nucleolar RNA-associated protein MPP10 [Colletotrichum tanaceti]TKW55396.1 U3 small nucleolar RNA-associated protein MPP10 [Colletotrichum tanaceti]
MAAGSSTSSSLTSTTNTLTFAPGMAAQLPPGGVADVRALYDNLSAEKRHAFLQPPPAIPSASLQVVKDTLDAFAGQISDEQLRLLKEASKKRKRADGSARVDVLKIRKVHVDGFETGQVWQQARRIIQSALNHSKETLQELEERKEIVQSSVIGEESLVGSDAEDSEIDDEDSSDDDELSGSDLEGVEEDSDEEEVDGSDVEGLTGDLEDDGEEVENEDEDADEDEEEEEEEEGEDDEEEYVEDPNGLNDGFFSIDEFNKQTQWFEEQDARGDPNTDANSDDEDIDWTADPLAPSNKSESSKRKNKDEMEEDAGSDEEEEEDGPTFGDMDLDAPEGASDDEDMDNAMEDDQEFNANGIYFKDFFAPPAKKASKDGKYKKNRSVRFAPKKVTDEDVERAMEDVKRDLFHDESDHGEDSDDALSDVSAGDPRSRRSAHERRQAKLAEEIRKLEAESVAKRQWTLTGEASAVERPMNSLLEEDLAFEHLGKPVPVITAEVSEGIEDLIKRRILAQDFDEVLRRRPDADLPANTRRGLVELDDSKSGKGLAEIYEEEHIKNADPDNYVSKSDEKLQREEQEVEKMWKDLSAKLDSLSSWHYKPKAAAPSLTVVSDAATIAMEDAQPTTAQGVSGGQSSIAPQEVYKAGKDTAEAGEVVGKSGLPMARQEMSREDKVRRRRREKERIRKAGGTDKKPLSKKAQTQKDTIADLKKGGVKVINRKGEVVDVDGNKAKAVAKATSSSFKL